VLEAVRIGPGGLRMPVALKRLAADQAIRGDMVQRFFTEARILARLDHPNIVRVHDVLAVDSAYFIVMELLRGATTAELAAHGGDRTPWPEVLARWQSSRPPLHRPEPDAVRGARGHLTAPHAGG